MVASLRSATASDSPTLARFHRLMFEEMAAQDGRAWDQARTQAMEAASQDYFRQGLRDRSVTAWVVEVEKEIAAAGALTLRQGPPVPTSTATRLGHLHSLYTLPSHRQQGLALIIVRTALEWGRANGLRSITLNASRAARPMYTALGFLASETAMALDLH